MNGFCFNCDKGSPGCKKCNVTETQNQNGQNIPYFYKKKNVKYTNYGQDNENQKENIDGQYIIESPADQHIKINFLSIH